MWIPDLSKYKSPLYLAFADAIEQDIKEEKLAEGDRLPTHRDLADALGVTVGTITRGYAEAERRKLIKGEVGRGTYIHQENNIRLPMALKEDQEPHLNLAQSYPVVSLNPSLTEALMALSRDPHIGQTLCYGPAEGFWKHREAGSEWLERFGINVSPRNVVMCSGGQHAIQVLLQALFKVGDHLIVDELTYPGIIWPAIEMGIKLIPIPHDATGMSMEALEAVCQRHKVQGVFTMPGVHNPTTHTMPQEKRDQLVELAQQYDFLIIEDDPFVPLLNENLEPIFLSAPERTLYIATTSKALAGGLRVAFIATPRKYMPFIANKIHQISWMAAPLMGEIASRWIRSGEVDQVISQRKKEAKCRYQLATRVLGNNKIIGAEDKHFIWLKLPHDKDSRMAEKTLESQGIKVLGEHSFCMEEKRKSHHLRISLGSIDNKELLEQALNSVNDYCRILLP